MTPISRCCWVTTFRPSPDEIQNRHFLARRLDKKRTDTNMTLTNSRKAERGPMIYQAYSIRDSKTSIFNPPQFRNTHGEAERDFHALVNDPQSLPGKYPKDYAMWHIGSYDTDHGVLTPITPVLLVDGDQLLARSHQS